MPKHRYFINKLASKIYRIERDCVKEFKGNYDYYIQNYIKETEEVAVENVKKNDYKERKAQEAAQRKKDNAIKRIENEITVIEEEIKKLEELSLTDEYAKEYTKAMEIVAKIEELKAKLEKLYEELEHLMG